jgi:hypothetical protein
LGSDSQLQLNKGSNASKFQHSYTTGPQLPQLPPASAMQLTIAAWDDRVFPVELDANEPFATLMAILEAESGLPAAQQQLLHNGRPVPPSAHGQGLTALGIADGDMLMLMPLQQQGGAGQGQQQRAGAGAVLGSSR